MVKFLGPAPSAPEDIITKALLDAKAGLAGTETFTGAKTFALPPIIGVNAGVARLDFSDPGVGGTQEFRFLRSSDAAGMRLSEATGDNILYEFWMTDNPDGGDYFSWNFGDYQGAGGKWEPLRIGALQNEYRAKNHAFYGPISQSVTPWYSANGTPSTVYKLGTGTLTLTPNVAAYNGTTTVFWVKLDSATTFQWGTGGVGLNIVASNVTITGSAQTLNQAVTVTFSGTTGGVLADTYQFRVSASGTATFGTVVATTLTLTNALTQAKSHASPDTDTATTSLHHTLGTGANQAAAGNHTHLAAGVTDFSTAADARVVAGITGKADLVSPALTGSPTVNGFAPLTVDTLGKAYRGTTANTVTTGKDTWAKILSIRLISQYQDATVRLRLVGSSSGSATALSADLVVRLKQQNTMGAVAAYSLYAGAFLAGMALDRLSFVITANSATETIGELWMKAPNDYEITSFQELISSVTGGVVTYSSNSAWQASLPSGSAIIASSIGAKVDVGLSNVDNTSDVNKPVSTAQAAGDTAAKARANHTGTQLASTVSDFSTAADLRVVAGITGKANTTHTHATSDVTGLDTALAVNRAGGIDIRSYGAVDGAADNTTAIRAAVTAATGGLLIIPPGLWNTDPISLDSNTSVHVYGTLKLRGQDVANLPLAFGVLYAYGDATTHKSRVKIYGFGGKIDGNRRGMTGSFTFDQECINFKYVDHGAIVGLELSDSIESGIDLDISTNNIIQDNYSHDNYGNGFHMSNGAQDNLIMGNIAENNGFGNDRNGFDQYSGSNPHATRNRYVGNRSINNNRNYKINGEEALFTGNVSYGGTNPDVITAMLDTLEPNAAILSMRAIVQEPLGGTTVDREARQSIMDILTALNSIGAVNGPQLFLSDDFTRADVVNSLGVSTNGKTWSGTNWSISSNKAIRASTSTSLNAACVTGFAPTSMRISGTIVTGAVRTAAGFSLGATDTGISTALTVDLVVAASGINGVRLRRRDAGVNTDTVYTGVVLAVSTSYVLRVDKTVTAALGTRIDVFLNGANVINMYLPSAEATLFANLDFVGPYSNKSGTQDDGTATWDDVMMWSRPTG